MVINETLFNCTQKTGNEEINIMDDCSEYIGYAPQEYIIVYKVLSIISFVMNFLFLIFQFKQIKRKNKKNKRKTSMRILYQFLPFFDCITSIYWIISSFSFEQALDMKSNYTYCAGLSIFYLINAF